MNDSLFSPMESRLVNKLMERGDIAISVLFRAIKKRWPVEEETNRIQQQHVGAVISRVNRKLRIKKLKIVPGESRTSYRIVKI